MFDRLFTREYGGGIIVAKIKRGDGGLGYG